MATSSLQRDREYLVEEDRRWLCSLGLPQLLFEFDNSFTDDDQQIDWLSKRLQRTPLNRALNGKRPAPADAAANAPADKRSRAAGGSA